MQRLIAIVLPEPVAILIASRWRFGLAGLDRHPVLGELEQILQPAHRLDLGQVDERLDGLALAEVEAERRAVLGAVLVGEPEPEQPPRGRRGARIALRAPRVDARPDAVDGIRALAGLAPLRDGVRVARRRERDLWAHLMRTSASLVVSLPKMSMIFTTIA